MRVLGFVAFATGFIALLAMLMIDILGVAEVRTAWFASLSMVLMCAVLFVPALRDLGRSKNG